MSESATTAKRKAPAKKPARRATTRKPATAKPVNSVTVTISEFEQAIARVKPFACTDETLPMINGIAFQLHDRVLTVVATDRFTLGANIINPVFHDGNTELPADFEIVIRLVELPILMGTLKRSKAKVINRIELEIVDGQFIVDGVRIGDTDLTGKFPNWRKLIADTERQATTAPEFGEVALNPAYLRRFAQIRPRPAMRVTTPSKPVIASSGDFVGILMPLRMLDTRADVLSRLGISTADAKPKAAA